MDFNTLLKSQRDFFRTRTTWPVEYRVAALLKLSKAIEEREADIFQALHDDLRKPPMEAYSSEIGLVQSEIRFAAKRVGKWVKPHRRRSPRMAWPSRLRLFPEPRGTVLILGPWNYPFQLLFLPLVGAIAAGCCAVVKPSELAPRSAKVIADLIAAACDPRHVAVVQGDADVSRALMQHRFDSIFFTGSTTVGREVMSAAAKHLTPVTLELGGKCPCIVCDDVSVDLAARRIIWGKMMNAGQTCVAPDFVLVTRAKAEALIAAMKTAIEGFYPAGARHSPDFGRIVNRRHFDRLTGYLESGTIAHGGENDPDDLFIAPTLVKDPPADAAIMQEEIFGPILPIVVVDDVDQAFRMLADRPTPLAAYLFTKDRSRQRRAAAELRCGGLCINDVVVQITGKDYPFGGLGESGLGSYHGQASFDAFTHYKTVLRCSATIDLRFRFPPVRLSMSLSKHVFRFLLT